VKPKAKTQIERMGFKDNDLKTSKHDEIMFWLDNYIKTEFLKKLEDSDLLKKYIGLKPKIVIEQNIWEKPILSKTKYNIGFIDLYLEIRIEFYKKKKDIYEQDANWYDYYFEVKSKLPSIGELLRQVNFYKSNIGDRGKFYVVAPKTNDKIKYLLKQQGVSFIEYPEKQKKPNLLENIVRRDSE